MYLTKKVYVKNWDHQPEKWEITIQHGNKPVETKLPIEYLEFQAAYWRKANQIHAWFVTNVQKGEDNCSEFYVSREQLERLLSLCKSVLVLAETAEDKITNSKEISALLPTESGFFFGSTEYDHYYLEDIQSTVDQLTIALEDSLVGDFYYRASW